MPFNPEQEAHDASLHEPEPYSLDNQENSLLNSKHDIEQENNFQTTALSETVNDTVADPGVAPEDGQNEEHRQEALIAATPPTSELEKALVAVLERKNAVIDRLQVEVAKLQTFVKKRKQTYKRKRKEDGAPVKPVSAYNLFIRERFAQLSRENEKALKSDNAGTEMKRVPPSSLITKTGHEWNNLAADIKAQFEERAKSDKKRYEQEMAKYDPPDGLGRKRNKTGYNIFFSKHVLRLKETESGVPSERGSVARLVGNAWKALSNEEKQYYEREADKHNGTNTGAVSTNNKDGDFELEDEEEEDDRQMHPHAPLMEQQYAYPPQHGGVIGHHGMAGLHAQPPHDPRAHAQYAYAQHVYAQNPYGGYDFSQHHQRHPQGRQQMYRYYDPSMGM